MRDRCEVLRYLSLSDETGGTTSVWTQAGSYPCRVESLQVGSAREGQSPGVGQQSDVAYLVHLPRTAHVLPQDRLGVPGWFNARQGSTRYEENAKVIPSGDKPSFFSVAMYGGTTSGGDIAFDAWPSQPGQTLVDGDVTWRYGGRVAALEVLGSDEAQSNEQELVVRVKEVR